MAVLIETYAWKQAIGFHGGRKSHKAVQNCVPRHGYTNTHQRSTGDRGFSNHGQTQMSFGIKTDVVSFQ